MKRSAFLKISVLTGLLLAFSSPVLSKDKDLFSQVNDLVSEGGGKIYITPEVEAEPLNSSDFPASFEVGMMTWDHDVIDVDQLEPGIDGSGVYVAVLDTGLVANWRDYFPEERIATHLGRGFTDAGVMQAIRTGKYTPNVVESSDFKGTGSSHGTHVTSTVIGYSFYGTPVTGVAPNATIIPVKVLATYNGIKEVFGTDAVIAAGINYIADLAYSMPDSRFVINMSLGSLSVISDIEAAAIDNAIVAGVIIVASAGNNGTDGMGSPGSYAPVISVGSTGWAFDLNTCSGEWVVFTDDCYLSNAFWYNDVPEDVSSEISYVSLFSSRERPDAAGLEESDQELDVLAPGSWVLGPYPQGNGFAHLPWWSQGKPNGKGFAGQYYFIGGTSMAAPHVAGIAALVVQANPDLMQAEVENILRASADAIPYAGVQPAINPNVGYMVIDWGIDGYNAVGYGLSQADAAVELATP